MLIQYLSDPSPEDEDLPQRLKDARPQTEVRGLKYLMAVIDSP